MYDRSVLGHAACSLCRFWVNRGVVIQNWRGNLIGFRLLHVCGGSRFDRFIGVLFDHRLPVYPNKPRYFFKANQRTPNCWHSQQRARQL